MTLSEMANSVCGIVHQTDSAGLAFCKTRLRENYETIWHDQLWLDSLVMVDVAVTQSTNTLHAAGFVLLPKIIAEVVAVRNVEDQEMVPESYETFFRYSKDYFENAGDPVVFVPTAPVVWQFASSTDVHVVQLADATDDGALVTLEYHDANDELVTQEAGVNAASKLVQSVLSIHSIYKPVTNQPIHVMDTGELQSYVIVPAASREAQRRQRIRLVEKPNDDINIRVLGKRTLLPLTDDNSYPLLAKGTNALMRFAEADMLKWQRQRATCERVYREADALLEQLKRTETYQRSYSPRLIPEPTAASTDSDFCCKRDYA